MHTWRACVSVSICHLPVCTVFMCMHVSVLWANRPFCGCYTRQRCRLSQRDGPDDNVAISFMVADNNKDGGVMIRHHLIVMLWPFGKCSWGWTVILFAANGMTSLDRRHVSTYRKNSRRCNWLNCDLKIVSTGNKITIKKTHRHRNRMEENYSVVLQFPPPNSRRCTSFLLTDVGVSDIKTVIGS